MRATWRSGRVRPLVSRATATELARVLAYPKFALTTREREDLLDDYLPFCETAVLPDPPPPIPRVRDPCDRPVLELALAASAEAVVSGDGGMPALADAFPIPVLSLPRNSGDACRVSAERKDDAGGQPRCGNRSGSFPRVAALPASDGSSLRFPGWETGSGSMPRTRTPKVLEHIAVPAGPVRPPSHGVGRGLGADSGQPLRSFPFPGAVLCPGRGRRWRGRWGEPSPEGRGAGGLTRPHGDGQPARGALPCHRTRSAGEDDAPGGQTRGTAVPGILPVPLSGIPLPC